MFSRRKEESFGYTLKAGWDYVIGQSTLSVLNILGLSRAVNYAAAYLREIEPLQRRRC